MGVVLLGLDIGTTSTKGVLLTDEGQIVARATSAPYLVTHPQLGWAEQNPADWWHAACAVIRDLGRQIDLARVGAVAVSGQGCATTLIDARGQVVRPALIWMDTRATAETAWLATEHGESLRRSNSNAAGVYNVEPKLLWLRDHEPDHYRQAEFTLTTTAFVVYCLTQRAVMNVADGGILFAYDAATRTWNLPLLAALGLRSSLYPPIAPCTEVIGAISASAAQACGLQTGTPVVAGGEDTPSAALASGVTQPGDAFLSLGTAAVVGVCVASRQGLHEPRLLTYPHVLPDLTITSGSMSSAGAAVEWLLREFGPAYGVGDDRYATLNQAISASPPGANGVIFLPYLSGELHPILDGNARGVFFGLSTATTRADMARAIIEGSALAIRHNLRVAEQAGAQITHLTASGGPTRSAPWCQIIADVTGYPLSVTTDDGAPLGDALLAGAGINVIPDVASLARSLRPPERSYAVQPRYRDRYDAFYTLYLQLYPHLAADFAQLATLPLAEDI